MHYKIFGNKRVDIVIEMGLGACISEWEGFADSICDHHGVLVYERAGIGKSEKSLNPRTPDYIVEKLHQLLDSMNHEDQLTIIGHSQGGLYAHRFFCKYPDEVKKLVLVDPLSNKDYFFKESLTEKEYKKSGVDKIKNFEIMLTMVKLHFGKLVKKQMRQAPPFYYYDGFSEKQAEEILQCYTNTIHLQTCLEEYEEAHKFDNLCGIKEKIKPLNIPIYLITHDSESAIIENMKFGNNTREFAEKIEKMWQDIMKDYLKYSTNASYIRANHSTHYIHLTEPEIIQKHI